MAKLPTINEVVSKSKRTKCGCCTQMIPTGQRFLRVQGVNYCIQSNCHTAPKYMASNHPDAIVGNVSDDVLEALPTAILGRTDWRDDPESMAERRMEHFAAHRAAGVSLEIAQENWDFDSRYMR
jgi:hypothetical protein